MVRPRLSIFVFLDKADGMPASKTLKVPMKQINAPDMMIKLVSKNKYIKIRDSESSSTDVFLVKRGLLLSRPNNGNVITRDNIKIEE